MTSIHGIPDGSFKAGTTTLATSTGQWKAVYLSGDNTVAPIGTLTNYSAFIGFTQNYANQSGGAISVRTMGYTKAILGAASITAGAIAKLVTDTTTNWGNIQTGDIKMGDTSTAGVSIILGKCVQGSQGGTGTVAEIYLNPQFSSAITTTVAS